MWTYFSISASAWGQARSKPGGVDTSILHHAFISIFIALWAVITRYVTILMAILSYFTRFIMKRENASSWDSGWKRSKYWKPILHSSKNPETPWKLFLELIRIIERRKHQRGPTSWQGGWGACPPILGAPPVSWAPWWPSDAHLLLHEGFYPGKKIISMLTGRNSAATRRNLGGTNLGLRRSCSAKETSLWEGEIITIVITNDPLIRRGSISINIFTSTISSQTLVHLLYPILYQNHKSVPMGC